MISKSLYCKYKECPNSRVWLSAHAANKADPVPDVIQAEIDKGIEVGSLAKSFFHNSIDCSCTRDGEIATDQQIARTQEALCNGAETICEASFGYEDLFCAVDILRKEDDGCSIYEVKSSKEIKEKHLYDISFQAYVLRKCGINGKHLYIMHVNKNYVFRAPLDLRGFFTIACVDDDPVMIKNLGNIEAEINAIREIITQPVEPKTVFSKDACPNCEFSSHCRRNLPHDCIDIINGVKTAAYDFYNRGIFTAKEFVDSGGKSSRPLGKLQIERIRQGIVSTHIEKDAIRSFIESVGKGPIYYLDFETTSCIVPKVDGFVPDEKFPYQYSLHIEYPDGRIEHKEYLGDTYDCGEELTQRLIEDIPLDSCVMAYHMSTERGFIAYLAKKYPKYEGHLLNIRDHHFIDLLDVFHKGYFYDERQRGQNSIKVVMPILCPHMADAYKNLPEIHNGGDALKAFHTLLACKGTPRYDALRNGMLEYCKLDTLSMVEVYHALIKLAE